MYVYMYVLQSTVTFMGLRNAENYILTIMLLTNKQSKFLSDLDMLINAQKVLKLFF